MLLKKMLPYTHLCLFIRSAIKALSKSVSILIYSLLFCILTPSSWPLPNTAEAQDIRVVVRGSGYDVPRFLSLKSNKANMRVGPGNEYPIAWVYNRKGLPVKVIAEYEVWRKVVDHEGTTGWMHTNLLTGRRTALITDRIVKLYKSNEDNSDVVGYAERNVLMELQYCKARFCRVADPSLKGWLKRNDFWGLLEDENLD